MRTVIPRQSVCVPAIPAGTTRQPECWAMNAAPRLIGCSSSGGASIWSHPSGKSASRFPAASTATDRPSDSRFESPRVETGTMPPNSQITARWNGVREVAWAEPRK